MSAGAWHHASWIKLASWRDSTEPGTGYRTGSLGQPGDFSATVRQSTSGGDWRNPQGSFDWRVSRQRTMCEGPDENGRWWSGDYASGTEAGFGKAKSAATRALREHRTAHIAAGGDVGYGDAPTGEQIRQAMAASRRQPARARQQAAETGDLFGLPGTPGQHLVEGHLADAGEIIRYAAATRELHAEHDCAHAFPGISPHRPHEHPEPLPLGEPDYAPFHSPGPHEPFLPWAAPDMEAGA